MKKESQKKLTLNKETIAQLESGQLQEVAGGASLDILCPTRRSCPITW